MTKAREWTYEGTQLAWLKERLGRPEPGPGHVVSEIVPRGFEAYVRIFHRFEARDGSGRSCTWQASARESGVPFHAELSHWSLRGGESDSTGRSLFYAQDGALDSQSRQALASLLITASGDEAVYFAYDLAALLWTDGAKPLIHHVPLADLGSLRDSMMDLVGDSGPEFWWPNNRAWVVTTDFDLRSTYVGCSKETAELLLADEVLESLPVAAETRVDWDADQTQ
ncbi:hypothetical protein [Streptomyces sp. NPDC001828]|uniref:hypothetical protein n=1 Tax=Streptomyces sp. NPDC001828 TaxID=3364615 RepID=UPI0036A3247F